MRKEFYDKYEEAAFHMTHNFLAEISGWILSMPSAKRAITKARKKHVRAIANYVRRSVRRRK